MLGVENGLAHPTVSAGVNLPLRQIHLGSLAAAVQLFDLTPADGTWRVLGPERPRHRNGDLRDPRRCRRPQPVGLLVTGVPHVRASAWAFPRVRLTHAGHSWPTASERHRPVSASISSLLAKVRNDRPGPLRRHKWQIAHSEFMDAHRIGYRSRRGFGTGADW